MVFLFHLQIFNQLQLGSAGVSFFFVLSGFILAYNYHSKFIKLDTTAIRNFYKARFAKIYPVHFITFLISAPLVLLSFHPNGFYLFKLGYMVGINLFLIHSFFPTGYFNFNGVSWTLSVEAFFYITFPYLIWLFLKLRVKNNILKTLLIYCLSWTIMFVLNKNLVEDNSILVWALHIFPVTRLFDFSTGVVAGLIFIEHLNGKEVKKKLFSCLELLSILIFLSGLFYSAKLEVGIVRGVYFIPIWCMLIYVFAFQKGIFSRLLTQKYFVYLGEISFSFYMIHQLVIRYFSYLKLNSTMNFCLCLILALGLSIIMYQFYEEPLRKRIRYGAKSTRKTVHKKEASV
jgi:peptidoglycan/LPS O-acetylase OafA/YrhL